jgi:hypothetical protein
MTNPNFLACRNTVCPLRTDCDRYKAWSQGRPTSSTVFSPDWKDEVLADVECRHFIKVKSES